MKNNMKIVAYMLGALIVLGSCEKGGVYKEPENQGSSKEDFFDFSTTQHVQLELAYQSPEGYRGKFEVYAENPFYVDEYQNYQKKEGVEPFMAGYTKADGTVSFPLELPAYVSEIYVYSPAIGFPSLLSAKIENGKLTPMQPVQPADVKSRAAEKPYYTNWTKQTLEWKKLQDWSADGTPGNLLAEKLVLGTEDLEIIDATIPKGELMDMRFSGLSIISLTEEAHVKLYYVSRGDSRRTNALAYYVYEEKEHPSQSYVNEHLIMLYPNLSDDVLSAGDGIQLQYYNEASGLFEDTFPAGSKIGIVLLVDAWQGNGEVAGKSNVMYSWRNFNSYRIPGVSIMGERPQMAMFKTEDKIILSFEDQPWTEKPGSPYLGDFRDNVFVLDVDPVKALPDIPDGQKPELPDGNIVDFYSKFGILAFEDVWPYKGDYDMNDVVIKYKSTTYCNSEFAITGVVDTFVFLNNGASFENGFGYQMGAERSNIKNIEIISDYKCEGQGLDPSLDKATVMLFDNGRNVPAGTVFVVKVWLKEATYPLNGYTLAPYNPFITIGSFMRQGRKELHLVNYQPTLKADMDLLGYGHDLSIPEKGIYYVSDAEYPFALDFNGLKEYQLPAETQKISDKYPTFGKWVASGKKDFTDWYLHPVE